MKSFLSTRLTARVAFCLFWLFSTSSFSQMLKEDRNNYHSPSQINKVEILVRKPPFIFSPHLSYMEQKKMLLAKKKVGGITFIIKSKGIKRTTTNYKQTNIRTQSDKTSGEIDADSPPYVRYELTDTTSK